MTTTLDDRPVVLTPTDDPRPVERAVVDGLLDDYDPETFLWITFHLPSGGARVYYAWTTGGQPLGNQIDQEALAAGYDCADWLHITIRHCQEATRGRVTIQAHPLRPIHADVRTGYRTGDADRDKLRQLLDTACDMTGQARVTDRPIPRWCGVGPALLTSR